MSGSYLKKYLFLCAGLFIMAIGVGLSIKADLGTSPISSVPYVVSLVSPLTVGTATIIMHCVFIMLQMLVLRDRYKPVQLLQLPVALVFGAMTDIALWLLSGVHYSSYFSQCCLAVTGIFLVAVGVSAEVIAGVVTLAGEGLVLAICQAVSAKFGNVKVGFDCALVATAALIALTAAGSLLGIGEGTIAAAVFVGIISKQLLRFASRFKKA